MFLFCVKLAVDMTWQTHVAIGANAAWLTALSGQTHEWSLLMLAVGAFASLLPDLDAVGSGAKIHYVGGGIFSMFKNSFRHRGFMHSLVAGMLILLVSVLFVGRINPFLPGVIVLGYISHPFIDGLNLTGVQYFFPSSRKFNVAPRFLRSPVRGWADQLLFVLGTMGVISYIFLFGYLR